MCSEGECLDLNISGNITEGYDDAIFFDHPEEMLNPWTTNYYFFPIVLTYVVAFVVGVSGNVIVIVVMAGDRASRNVTSIFLVSLAIADLLLLVICAPLDVAHYFVVQWDKDGTVCKMAAYAEMVSAFASVLNLVAVTLERFVVIVFPIQSRSLCTMSNCKKLVIIVWIISLVLAGPVVATKNTVKTTFTNKIKSVTLFSCKEFEDWRGYGVAVYRLVALFLLPSILMIVCYTWVILELWVSTRTMDQLTNSLSEGRLKKVDSRSSISTDATIQSTGSNPHRVILRNHISSDMRDVKKARQQVIKMLILVVVLFLVCWGPRLLMELVIKCCLDVFNHAVYTTRFIFYLLPFVHSCLNPIVYCFMSTKFRRRMENLCGRSRNKTQTRLKHSASRNGTTRANSTYTVSSYAPSSVCSPATEITKLTELETLTL